MGRWGDGEMGRWGDGEMGKWGDGEMGRWGAHKGRFFTFGSCPTPNPRPVGGGSQGEEKENNE
ncbi:hypothetical protein [Moorena producens]|uniref:hypothetical protein n=1 Tax=Moorena producens TaxID=1155739 RepID=UPI0009F42D6E|nr:hypothetical protein [Moorena producens]